MPHDGTTFLVRLLSGHKSRRPCKSSSSRYLSRSYLDTRLLGSRSALLCNEAVGLGSASTGSVWDCRFVKLHVPSKMSIACPPFPPKCGPQTRLERRGALERQKQTLNDGGVRQEITHRPASWSPPDLPPHRRICASTVESKMELHVTYPGRGRVRVMLVQSPGADPPAGANSQVPSTASSLRR